MKSNFSSTSFSSVCLLIFLSFVGLVAGLKPFVEEVKFTFDWRHVFDEALDFGKDSCSLWSEVQSETTTLAQVLEIGRQKATPFRMPFRSNLENLDRVARTKWIYVRCSVDLSNRGSVQASHVFLGPVWGQSQFFLNGELVRNTSRKTMVSIPLDGAHSSGPISLEVASLKEETGASMRSLMPIVVVKDDQQLDEIMRLFFYFNRERPLPYLGICLALTSLFFCVWFFGVRYRDIYWMIAASLSGAAICGLDYFPIGTPPEWFERFRYFMSCMFWMSLFAAVYTFLRRPAKQLHIIAVVLAVPVLLQAQYLIPIPLMLKYIGGIDRYDIIPIGLILFILGYMAGRINPELPRRRYLQRRVLSLFLYSLGATCFCAGFLQLKYGFTVEYFTRGIILFAFGVFMMVDLVIFQRGYFEEKSLKEEEERRRTALEDRMELGFSIQKLFMPKNDVEDYGRAKIHSFYGRSDFMAGDWYYWSKAKDNLIKVICGDVVGKGPQAAISATSLMTQCRSHSFLTTNMKDFLTQLNDSICSIFGNQSVSTVAACSIDEDLNAELVNHGFAGWMHVSGKTINIPSLRGPNLGSSSITEWSSAKIKLAKGDLLVIFSDGIAEGPRAIKKIAKIFQDRIPSKTIADLISEVIEAGKTSVVDDDRTLIVIEAT